MLARIARAPLLRLISSHRSTQRPPVPRKLQIGNIVKVQRRFLHPSLVALPLAGSDKDYVSPLRVVDFAERNIRNKREEVAVLQYVRQGYATVSLTTLDVHCSKLAQPAAPPPPPAAVAAVAAAVAAVHPLPATHIVAPAAPPPAPTVIAASSATPAHAAFVPPPQPVHPAPLAAPAAAAVPSDELAEDVADDLDETEDDRDGADNPFAPAAAPEPAQAAIAAAPGTAAGTQAPTLPAGLEVGPFAPIALDDPERSVFGYRRVPGLKVHLARLTPATVFMVFFSAATLDRVLQATSNADPTLSLVAGEFWAFFAIIQLMALYPGRTRDELWSPSPSRWCPVPPFRSVMSRSRFERIITALRIAVRPTSAPPFADTRDAQLLVDDFNRNMKDKFECGTRVCLDESMCTFDNADCPSFVHVERKPHPNGNEYHSMADVLTAIIFALELVVGAAYKAAEGYRRPPYEAEFGLTGGLIIRLTEVLRGLGCIVAMDSAFCLPEVLLALRERGIFACTVAKKKRYWPRFVAAESILAHMQGKPVGEIHGRIHKLHAKAFRIFAVNHRKYTFILVATYGTTITRGPERSVRTTDGVLKYARTQVLEDYYESRHAVDDNNRTRQGPKVALDEAWPCRDWCHRQLLFFLALAEANALQWYNYAARQQGQPTMTVMHFRARLAEELLDAWVKEKEPADEARDPASLQPGEPKHKLVVIPGKHGPWANGGFKPAASRNHSVRCSGRCGSQVRYVCWCDRRLAFCKGCHAAHVAASYEEP